jgi:hypothetical protein
MRVLSAIVAIILLNFSSAHADNTEFSPDAAREGQNHGEGTANNSGRARNAVRFAMPAQDKFMLDVNDSFLVSSMIDKSHKRTVEFSILDGVRSIFGNCQSKKRIDIGTKRETWVKFEFGAPNSNGLRNVVLHRTLDFHGNTRIYEFDISERGGAFDLDPGIRMHYRDGKLQYTQSVQPIGPNERKYLEIEFDVYNLSSNMTGDVRIESETWQFSIDELQAIVNGISVNKRVAGDRETDIVIPPHVNLTAIKLEPERTAALNIGGDTSEYTIINKITPVNIKAMTVSQIVGCSPLDCSGDGAASTTCTGQSPACDCSRATGYCVIMTSAMRSVDEAGNQLTQLAPSR